MPQKCGKRPARTKRQNCTNVKDKLTAVTRHSLSRKQSCSAVSVTTLLRPQVAVATDAAIKLVARQTKPKLLLAESVKGGLSCHVAKASAPRSPTSCAPKLLATLSRTRRCLPWIMTAW